MRGKLVLVGGGVRCGKSRFALERALALPGPRAFIATAETLDAEMQERARRHRAERGAGFQTIEEPVRVVEALSAAAASVVVVDCITLWLSNLMALPLGEAEILNQVERLAAAAVAGGGTTLLVSNEVGMGVVPDSPLGRAFRDLCGAAHQRLARASDEVYLGAMGLLLRVKPNLSLAQGEGR